MARIGYARVSTRDQDTGSQLHALSVANIDRLFQETGSGANNKRPELAKALAACEAGDTLVFWSLSRLARSTQLNEVAPSPAQSDAEAHNARQRFHWQQILQEAGLDGWDDDSFIDRMVAVVDSLGYAIAREVSTISPRPPEESDPEARVAR
jgi:hypothetical protein